MKKLNKMNYEITDHVSFAGFYIKASFEKMLDLLGQPSYVGSGDNKVQVEWVFYDKEDNQKVVTFYDWKSEKILSTITKWHVGSKTLDKQEVYNELSELGLCSDEIIKEGEN